MFRVHQKELNFMSNLCAILPIILTLVFFFVFFLRNAQSRLFIPRRCNCILLHTIVAV